MTRAHVNPDLEKKWKDAVWSSLPASLRLCSDRFEFRCDGCERQHQDWAVRPSFGSAGTGILCQRVGSCGADQARWRRPVARKTPRGYQADQRTCIALTQDPLRAGHYPPELLSDHLGAMLSAVLDPPDVPRSAAVNVVERATSYLREQLAHSPMLRTSSASFTKPPA